MSPATDIAKTSLFAGHLSGAQVPKFEPNGSKNRLLLVILAELDQTTREKLLMEINRDINKMDFDHRDDSKPDNLDDPRLQIQTWAPERGLLESVAKQGEYRDSQANLYAVAKLLYQSGWDEFVVADEKTKRIITGTRRHGEVPNLSLILMKVGQGWQLRNPHFPPPRINSDRKDSSTHASKDELFVKARRVDAFTFFGQLTHKTDEKPNMHSLPYLSLYRQTLDERTKDSPYNSGMWLYDPDNQPLRIDRVDSSPRVQFEEVASRDSIEPVVWNKDRVFFLLFETTAEQREMLQSEIQTAADKYIEEVGKQEIELIPLESHGIRSRRDLTTFQEKYCAKNQDLGKEILYLRLLLSAPAGEDIESAEFAKVFSDNHNVNQLARTSFKQFLSPDWPEEYLHSERPALLTDTAESHGLEILINPDEPFYFNMSPWPENYGYPKAYYDPHQVTVWYLTKGLKPEEDEAIREELQTDCDAYAPHNTEKDKKAFSFIPWAGEEDATLEDIWNMLSFEDVLVCIDRQSGKDKSIMIVDSWTYEEYFELDADAEEVGEKYRPLLAHLPIPHLRGLQYARYPGRQAYDEMMRLEVNGGDLLYADVVKFWRRPGWPAKGVLPDDDEDEYILD